jgi:hypothetical protein
MDHLHLDPPFAIGTNRLAEDCRAHFASNSALGTRCSWFLRYDKSIIEIRSIREPTYTLIGSVSISDFSSEHLEIRQAIHLEIQGHDYILFHTMGRKDRLWLLDPYSLAVHPVPVHLDGCDVLQVSKGSNGTSSSYFAVSQEQKVTLYMITHGESAGIRVSVFCNNSGTFDVRTE